LVVSAVSVVRVVLVFLAGLVAPVAPVAPVFLAVPVAPVALAAPVVGYDCSGCDYSAGQLTGDALNRGYRQAGWSYPALLQSRRRGFFFARSFRRRRVVGPGYRGFVGSFVHLAARCRMHSYPLTCGLCGCSLARGSGAIHWLPP